MNIKKFISIITTACFLFSVLTQNVSASYNNNVFINDEYANNLLLSNKFGRITDISNSNNQLKVINIQDLHSNYSAQTNIKNILEFLDSQYIIKNIFVEGGYGNIDTSWINKIKDSSFRDRLIEQLMLEGKLTGTEYFAYKKGNNNLLYGLENKEIHKQNLYRLSQILDKQPMFNAELQKIKSDIDFLSFKYCSKENLYLNKILKKYNSNEINSISFYKYIIENVNKINNSNKKYNNFVSINTNLFENINCYLEIGSRKINNKKVHKELYSILSLFKQVLSYDEYVNIVKDTNNLSDIQKLSKQIIDVSKQQNIDLKNKYPNLYAFVEKNELVSKINPIKLITEERILLNVLRQSFSKNETEYEISFLSDFYDTFADYLKNKITSDNYDYFVENISKFKQIYSKYAIVDRIASLEKDFELLDKYYSVNNLRNNIFLQNIIKDAQLDKLNVNKKEVVVVVSGGYHTKGLSNLLKSKDISYITITPNITTSILDSDKFYKQIVREQTEVNYNALNFTIASSTTDIELFNSLMRSGIEIFGGIYSKDIFEKIVEQIKPLVKQDVIFNYSNVQATITIGNKDIVFTNVNGKIQDFTVNNINETVEINTSFINKLFESNPKLNFSDGIIFELRNADKVVTDIKGFDLSVISRFPSLIQKYFYNLLSNDIKEKISEIDKTQTLTKDTKALSKINKIKEKRRRNRLLKLYSTLIAPLIEAPMISKIFNLRYVDSILYQDKIDSFFNQHKEYVNGDEKVKKNFEYDLDIIINTMQVAYDKTISTIHNEKIAKIVANIVGIKAHKKVNKYKFKIEKQKLTIGQKIKKFVKGTIITFLTALLIALGVATYMHPSDLTSTISSNIYAITNIDLSSEENYYESLIKIKMEWTDTYMPDLDNLYYTFTWKYQLYQMENQISDGLDVILSNESLSSLLHQAYTDNEIEYLKILSVRNDRNKLKSIANDTTLDRYYRFYAHMLLIEDGYKQKDGEFEELFNEDKVWEWINYSDETQIELTDFEWQTKCYVVKEFTDVDISEWYVVRFARLINTPQGSTIVARSDLSYGSRNIKSDIWATTAHEIGHNDMDNKLFILNLLPSSSMKELYAYSWETYFSLQAGINSYTYNSQSLMSVDDSTEEHDAGRAVITSVNENLGKEYSQLLSDSIIEYYKTIPLNKSVREETLGILDIFVDKVIDKEIQEHKITESNREERKIELTAIILNYKGYFSKYIENSNSNEKIKELSQYIDGISQNISTEDEFFKALFDIKIQMTSPNSGLFPEGADQAYLSKWNSVMNRLNETIVSNMDYIQKNKELNVLFNQIYTDDEVEYIKIYNLSLDKEDSSKLENIVTGDKDLKYRFYAYMSLSQSHRNLRDEYSKEFSDKELIQYLEQYAASNPEMTEISNYDWQVLCGMTQLLYDKDQFTIYSFDSIFSTKYDEQINYSENFVFNPYWYQYSLDYVKSKTKNPVLIAVVANELYCINRCVISVNPQTADVKNDLMQLYVDTCLIQASRDLSIDINFDFNTSYAIENIKNGTSAQDISKIVLNEVINKYGYDALPLLKKSIYEYISTGGPVYKALSYIQSNLSSIKSIDEYEILVNNYIAENDLTEESKQGILEFTGLFLDGRTTIQARDFGTRLARYSNFLPGEELNVNEVMKIFYEKIGEKPQLTKDNKVTTLIDRIKNNRIRSTIKNIYSVVVAPLLEASIINNIYYEKDEGIKQAKIDKFLEEHKGYRQGDQKVQQSYEQGIDFILRSMKESYDKIYNKTHCQKIAKLAVTISNIKYHKKWNRENLTKKEKSMIATVIMVLMSLLLLITTILPMTSFSSTKAEKFSYTSYSYNNEYSDVYFDYIYKILDINVEYMSDAEKEKTQNLRKTIEEIISKNGENQFYKSIFEIRQLISTNVDGGYLPTISDKEFVFAEVWKQLITYIDDIVAFNINDIKNNEQLNTMMQETYTSSEIEYINILSIKSVDELKSIINDNNMDFAHRFYAYMVLKTDGYNEKKNEFNKITNKDAIYKYFNDSYIFVDEKGSTKFKNVENSYDWQVLCGMMNYVLDAKEDYKYILQNGRMVDSGMDENGIDAAAKSNLLYAHSSQEFLVSADSSPILIAAHEMAHRRQNNTFGYLSNTMELYAYTIENIIGEEIGVNVDYLLTIPAYTITAETETHKVGRIVIQSLKRVLGVDSLEYLEDSIVEYVKHNSGKNNTQVEMVDDILKNSVSKFVDQEILDGKIDKAQKDAKINELLSQIYGYSTFFDSIYSVQNEALFNQQDKDLKEYIYSAFAGISSKEDFYSKLLEIRYYIKINEPTVTTYSNVWKRIIVSIDETIASNIEYIQYNTSLSKQLNSIYTEKEKEYLKIITNAESLEDIITSNTDIEYRFYAYMLFIQQNRKAAVKYEDYFSQDDIKAYLSKYSQLNPEMTEISDYDWQVLCGMVRFLSENKWNFYTFDNVFSIKYDDSIEYRTLTSYNSYLYQHSFNISKDLTKNPVLVAIVADSLYDAKNSYMGSSIEVSEVMEDLSKLYVDVCLIEASKELSIDINLNFDTNLEIKDIKDGTSPEDISKIVLKEVIDKYGYEALPILKQSIYEYLKRGGAIQGVLSDIYKQINDAGGTVTIEEFNSIVDKYLNENEIAEKTQEALNDFISKSCSNKTTVQSRDFSTSMSRYNGILAGEELNVNEVMKIFYEKIGEKPQLTKDNKVTTLIDRIKNNRIRSTIKNIYSVVVAPLLEASIINNIYYEKDEGIKQAKIDKFLEEHKGYRQGDQKVQQSYEQGIDFILSSMKKSYERIYTKTHCELIARLAVTVSNIKYHKQWNRENILKTLSGNKKSIFKRLLMVFLTVVIIGTSIFTGAYVERNHGGNLYSGYVNSYVAHLSYFEDVFNVSSNISEEAKNKIYTLENYVNSIVEKNGEENFYQSLIEIRKEITTSGSTLMPSISSEDNSYMKVWRKLVTYVDKTIAYNIDDIRQDDQLNTILQETYSQLEIGYLDILSIQDEDKLIEIINSNEDFMYRFYAYMILNANGYKETENEFKDITSKNTIYEYLNSVYIFEDENGSIKFRNVDNSFDWQVLCGMMNYVLDAQDDYLYILENGRIVEAKSDPDGINAMAKSNLLYAHVSSEIVMNANESPVLIAAHEMAHRKQNNTFGYLSNIMELYAYTMENIIGEDMGIEVNYMRAVPTYTLTNNTETHDLARTVIESLKRATGIDSLIYLEDSIVEYVESSPSKSTTQVEMVDQVLDSCITKIVEKEILEGTIEESQRQTRYNQLMCDIYGYNTFFDSIYSVENEALFSDTDKDFKEYIYSTFTNIENKEDFYSRLLEIRQYMKNNMPTISNYSDIWKKIMIQIDDMVISNIDYIQENKDLKNQLNSIYTNKEIEYLKVASNVEELEEVITSNKDINYRFYAYMLFIQQDRKAAAKYEETFSKQEIEEYLIKYSKENPSMTQISNYDWQVLCGMTQTLYGKKWNLYNIDNLISIKYDAQEKDNISTKNNIYIYQNSLVYAQGKTTNPVLISVIANELYNVENSVIGSNAHVTSVQADLTQLYVDTCMMQAAIDLGIELDIDFNADLQIADIKDGTSAQDISKIVLNEVINNYGYEALPILKESIYEYVSTGGPVYKALSYIQSNLGSIESMEEFETLVNNYIAENDLTEESKQGILEFTNAFFDGRKTVQSRDFGTRLARYSNFLPGEELNVNEVMKIFYEKLEETPTLTKDTFIVKLINNIKNKKIREKIKNIYSISVAPLIEARTINRIYYEKDEVRQTERKEEFLNEHNGYKDGNKEIKMQYNKGLDFVLSSMKIVYDKIYSRTHCAIIARLAVIIANINLHSKWNKNLTNRQSLISYTKQQLLKENPALISEIENLKFREIGNSIKVQYKYSSIKKPEILICENNISKEEFYLKIKSLIQTHSIDMDRIDFVGKVTYMFSEIYNITINKIIEALFPTTNKMAQVAVVYKSISASEIDSYVKYEKEQSDLLYENVFVINDNISDDIVNKFNFKPLGLKLNGNQIFISDISDTIFICSQNSNFDEMVSILKNNSSLLKKIINHINLDGNNINISNTSIISTKITSNIKNNVEIKDDLIEISENYNSYNLINILNSYIDIMTRQGFVVKENIFRYLDGISLSSTKEERKQAFINILQEQITTQLILDYDIFNQLRQDFGYDKFKELVNQLKEKSIRLYVCVSNDNKIKELNKDELISGYILFNDNDFINVNNGNEDKNISCKIFDSLTYDSFDAMFVAQSNSDTCNKIMNFINGNVLKQPLIFRDSSIKQAVNTQRDTTIFNNFKTMFNLGKITTILSDMKSSYNSKKFVSTYTIKELSESFGNEDIDKLVEMYNKYFNKGEQISAQVYSEFINILSKCESIKRFFDVSDISKIDNLDLFIENIIFRIAVAGVLKQQEKEMGLKNSKYEEILAKAIKMKVINNVTDDNIDNTVVQYAKIQDDLLKEQTLKQYIEDNIVNLTQRAFNNEKPDPMAINTIIFLMPYAETADIVVDISNMNLQQDLRLTKSILSAA